MPNNWKKYNVSEFIEINPKVILKKGIEYSFVEMKDLDSNNKYVLPSVFKEVKGGARFNNGDTLFARITPCLQNGKICQVKGLEGNLGFGSTEFLVFRGKEGVSNSDFIYYLSRTPFFRRFSESKMIGTSGRQRVVKDAYDHWELELPPLTEQKAIAEILSSLDDKIELNLQMNKTLEEMAMTLYKHWFVDFGPFKDGEFIDSELGKIPKGWEVKSLGDVSTVIDSLHKTPKYSEFGYPMVRVTDVKNGYLDLLKTFKVDEIVFNEFSNKYKPKKGDTILTRVGTYGLCSYVGTEESFCLGQNTVVVSPDIDGALLHLILLSKSIKTQIESQVTGSTQKTISLKSLRTLKLILPNNDVLLGEFKSEIKEFYEFVGDLLVENQTLTQTRDTLLPKLISGEIRVKEAKEIVKEVI